MNYKSFNLGDWIGHISGVIEDESELDGNEMRDLVEFLSMLEQEPKWIPVTERLPEDGERVLATHLGGINPNRQVIEHIYENGRFTCGWDVDLDITSPTFGQRYMGDVIAWMPLPKPYEEGAEEKKQPCGKCIHFNRCWEEREFMHIEADKDGNCPRYKEGAEE